MNPTVMPPLPQAQHESSVESQSLAEPIGMSPALAEVAKQWNQPDAQPAPPSTTGQDRPQSHVRFDLD